MCSDQSDTPAQCIHVDLAIDILKHCMTQTEAVSPSTYNSLVYSLICPLLATDQKSFCQLLGHLHLPAEINPKSLLKISILSSHLQEVRSFSQKYFLSNDRLLILPAISNAPWINQQRS
jgi:hypothetical protein